MQAYRRGFAWERTIVFGSVILFGGIERCWAQCDAVKLTASDAAEEDLFGLSVAISDQVAVVGAGLDDDDGEDSGAAYVYRFDGSRWLEEVKLTASDAHAGARFGAEVRVRGDRAVIAASRSDGNAGAVYVFRHDGMSWVEEAKLAASDAAVNDQFGFDIGWTDHMILVGSPGDDNLGPTSNSGSAYVFQFDGDRWREVAKLTASDAGFGDRFGSAVGVDQDTLVIGAFRNDDAGSNSGSAYVFRHVDGRYVEETNLLASDADAGDEFGWDLAISEGTILVGAWRNDDAGPHTGSAYIFREDNNGWFEEAKILSNDLTAGDEFGWDVDLDADTAVIGADGDASFAGAAYVYRRDGATWSRLAKVTADDAQANDLFVVAVAVSADHAVIAAYGNDDAGSRSGSAYILSGLLSGDCDGNGVLDHCDPDSDRDSVPDICDACADTLPGVTVDAIGCPQIIPGDTDGDGDVDLPDVLTCNACYTGPGLPAGPDCDACDLDGDNDVDLADLVAMQAAFTGAR